MGHGKVLIQATKSQPMSAITEAYHRGMAAGKASRLNIQRWMDLSVEWAKRHYPATRDLDYWSELVELDRARMQSPPDPVKFPETRGLTDRLVAERKGFAEACGAGPKELAFHYTWYFFLTRRLNTRHVGCGLRASHCSEVYIRESREGGPLFGRNIDDIRRPGMEDFPPPQQGPEGARQFHLWTDSGSVLCDEEPQEIFPVNVWEIKPPDCKRLPDIVEFLRRYVDFWGPNTAILVDEEQNVAVLEKSNCRMGVRPCPEGAAAITACSYLIPEMKSFRDNRHRLSLQLRGLDENSSDWVYWQGCDARHRRLLQLTSGANQRGATLDDMARIVTDHAVAFPDRICLAGERGHPDDMDANWTLTSEASVLEGANRRTLFWRVEGNQPCYDSAPFLVLGAGVQMKPEWSKGIRPFPTPGC